MNGAGSRSMSEPIKINCKTLTVRDIRTESTNSGSILDWPNSTLTYKRGLTKLLLFEIEELYYTVSYKSTD